MHGYEIDMEIEEHEEARLSAWARESTCSGCRFFEDCPCEDGCGWGICRETDEFVYGGDSPWSLGCESGAPR